VWSAKSEMCIFIVPTIICVCHSGTGVFSGDHCRYLSLNASAIPGPGCCLKHSHGTFYCFVCLRQVCGLDLPYFFNLVIPFDFVDGAVLWFTLPSPLLP
jgi:hypothetical protein